jgi:hypothetical protein
MKIKSLVFFSYPATITNRSVRRASAIGDLHANPPNAPAYASINGEPT